jgi:hypothetical protein
MISYLVELPVPQRSHVIAQMLEQMPPAQRPTFISGFRKRLRHETMAKIHHQLDALESIPSTAARYRLANQLVRRYPAMQEQIVKEYRRRIDRMPAPAAQPDGSYRWNNFVLGSMHRQRHQQKSQQKQKPHVVMMQQ